MLAHLIQYMIFSRKKIHKWLVQEPKDSERDVGTRYLNVTNKIYRKIGITIHSFYAVNVWYGTDSKSIELKSRVMLN